jgi:hypothetical protein
LLILKGATGLADGGIKVSAVEGAFRSGPDRRGFKNFLGTSHSFLDGEQFKFAVEVELAFESTISYSWSKLKSQLCPLGEGLLSLVQLLKPSDHILR